MQASERQREQDFSLRLGDYWKEGTGPARWPQSCWACIHTLAVRLSMEGGFKAHRYRSHSGAATPQVGMQP